MTTEAITLETGSHAVHFHQNDSELIRTVGGYVAKAVREGDATLIIATDNHRKGIAAHLDAAGIDVADAVRNGLFVGLDATDTLAQFYADGQLDADKFQALIGGAIRGIERRTGRTVRCHGAMVALLWEAGAITAALELEDLWNDLNAELDFSLLCTYPSRSVADSELASARQVIAQLHSEVIGDRHREAPPRQMHLPREVHQASGVVAVQLNTDPAHALERLRTLAADRDETLEEIARKVISGQLRFDDSEPV